MSIVHSDRERRLWAWTGAVVLAIYLSAGWAGTLARQLADRGHYEALSERIRAGGRVPLREAVAVVATGLLGWIDEGIQRAVPGRVYDLRDAGFHVLAGLGGVIGTIAIAWARRRVRTTDDGQET